MKNNRFSAIGYIFRSGFDWKYFVGSKIGCNIAVIFTKNASIVLAE